MGFMHCMRAAWVTELSRLCALLRPAARESISTAVTCALCGIGSADSCMSYPAQAAETMVPHFPGAIALSLPPSPGLHALASSDHTYGTVSVFATDPARDAGSDGGRVGTFPPMLEGMR